MNILITGSFGIVGNEVLEQIDTKKHNITCFDRITRKTRKRAKKFRKKTTIYWGDIRKKRDLKNAIKDTELILHLAFKLPPINDKNLAYAEATNIKGMKNLIEVCKEKEKPPKIIFASSVAIYGDTRNQKQPIAVSQIPKPFDPYSKHKVQCMKLLEQSGLTYSIFVLGVIPPHKKLGFDPMMYEVPVDTKIEVLHVYDAGLAFTNAIESKKIWNKIWHIGGGEKCRLEYMEFIQKSMIAMGIGKIPEEIFGGELYHSSWMSSEESNKILNYQTKSFEDILKDMQEQNKLVVSIAKRIQKPIKKILTRKSPYYKKKKKKD